MPKPSILWVVPVLAVLTGCGGVAATVNDRNEIQAGTVDKYKTCPASDIEFDREPGGYIGPFGWRGRLSEDGLAARRRGRQPRGPFPFLAPYRTYAKLENRAGHMDQARRAPPLRSGPLVLEVG